MKKLILSLSLTIVLVLAVAGCASVEESASGGTTEPGSAKGQTIAHENSLTTTRAVTATEQNNATTEKVSVTPEVTEESQVGAAETPMTQTAQSAPGSATPAQDQTVPAAKTDNMVRLSDLLGFEVWNDTDEQVGDVAGMIIDMDTSQIDYVVVGSGGFLGLGESKIPVPWQAFQIKTDEVTPDAKDNSGEISANDLQDVFILDVSTDRLEQAPTVDLDTVYDQAQTTVEAQDEVTGTQTFKEQEQAIQTFWQDEANQMGQMSGSDTLTATTEVTGTTSANSPVEGQVSDTSGIQNPILARDLMGAIIVNEPEQDEVVKQSGATDSTQSDMAEESTATTGQDTAEQIGSMVQVGQVQEAMTDEASGKITYLFVTLNNFSANPAETQQASGAEVAGQTGDQTPLGEVQLVPIPLDVLKWNADEEVLIYTDRQSLTKVPAINLEEYQSGQSDWKSQADSFWGMSSEDNNLPGS